ncbi:hypothetical protein DFH09DRAFT_1178992 [Mycena vulgaris]|nr:hypothetical protein DFH09DRAFT_1178992 [Mycena vulgaris]
MPPNATQAIEHISLAGQNKTAVVVGGTLGIGAGVARLLAKIGCSRIIILGRNEARGAGVLADLKKLAPEGQTIEVEFVKGDLIDSKGMRAAAEALQRVAGHAAIDYLVMCQNGVPSGRIDLNEDGHDEPFAIQAISRFALAYLLTTRRTLATNAIVMFIANTGQTMQDLRVDDLSMADKLAAGRWKAGFFMDQSKRDSTVMDSCIEELNIRYPEYRYFTLWPGLVSSEHFSVSGVPFPLNILMWLGIKLIGTTPDQYANIPVYILACPEARETLGTGKNYDWKLNPMTPGMWAKDPKNREALWEKLKEIIGEK